MSARLKKGGCRTSCSCRGSGWLCVFFAIPLFIMLLESLKTGTIDTGFTLTWEFSNYTDALSDYNEQFIRSFEYAGLATIFGAPDRLPARVRDRVPGRQVPQRAAAAR